MTLSTTVNKSNRDDAIADASMPQMSICKRRWFVQLQLLLEFKKEHGHCNVPYNYKPNPELGRWVKRQRFQYRLLQTSNKSHMTTDRIQLLEDIGFTWDLHEVQWQKMYDELLDFHRRHGHVDVPSKCHTLGMWVSNQRSQYKLYKQNKSSSMTEKRFNKLEDLGFRWEVKHKAPNKRGGKKVMKREDKRAVIAEYNKKFEKSGRFFVKKNLSVKKKSSTPKHRLIKQKTWTETLHFPTNDEVSSATSQEEDEVHSVTSSEVSSITQEEELPSPSSPESSAPPSPKPEKETSASSSNLDGMFMLSVLSGDENGIWMQHLKELVKYQRENGHCNVPLKQPGGLGRWVKRQRYQYKLLQSGNKKANMTKDRIKILNDLGFVWDLHQVQWDKMFGELLEYKKVHGHCDVPISEPTLGTWVTYQRYLYRLVTEKKSSSLTENRRKKLEDVGFKWEIRGFQQRTLDRHEKEAQEELENQVKRGQERECAQKSQKKSLYDNIINSIPEQTETEKLLRSINQPYPSLQAKQEEDLLHSALASQKEEQLLHEKILQSEAKAAALKATLRQVQQQRQMLQNPLMNPPPQLTTSIVTPTRSESEIYLDNLRRQLLLDPSSAAAGEIHLDKLRQLSLLNPPAATTNAALSLLAGLNAQINPNPFLLSQFS